MSPTPQSYRTLYQIFIYDRAISRFYRFTWEAAESPRSLKRAIQFKKHRSGDVDAILGTLIVLSAVRQKYLVCDGVVSCAHCGKEEDRVEIRFDFQQDTGRADGPLWHR